MDFLRKCNNFYFSPLFFLVKITEIFIRHFILCQTSHGCYKDLIHRVIKCIFIYKNTICNLYYVDFEQECSYNKKNINAERKRFISFVLEKRKLFDNFAKNFLSHFKIATS